MERLTKPIVNPLYLATCRLEVAGAGGADRDAADVGARLRTGGRNQGALYRRYGTLPRHWSLWGLVWKADVIGSAHLAAVPPLCPDPQRNDPRHQHLRWCAGTHAGSIHPMGLGQTSSRPVPFRPASRSPPPSANQVLAPVGRVPSDLHSPPPHPAEGPLPAFHLRLPYFHISDFGFLSVRTCCNKELVNGEPITRGTLAGTRPPPRSGHSRFCFCHNTHTVVPTSPRDTFESRSPLARLVGIQCH